MFILTYAILNLSQISNIGGFISFWPLIFQMSYLKLREVKILAKGHTVSHGKLRARSHSFHCSPPGVVLSVFMPVALALS